MDGNELFGRGNWLGTFVFLFACALLSFVICCGLGAFIDPSLDKDVRTGVVIGWCFLFLAIASATLIARHAD